MYRERAYDYFIEMMGTIEHRVVKGLLTARPRGGIESVNLEEKLLESYTNEGVLTQEHLSDEQVKTLIHTPLSSGSPIV